MKTSFKLIGKYVLKCYRADGKLSWRKTVHNSVMTVGKAEVINLMGNVSSPVAFTYLAVGTSSTAVSTGQTALGAEITDSGLARHTATATRTTTTSTNDTLSLTYTWTASGTKAIEEVGVFNASSSGTMLSRALTTTKNVYSGETLIGTYTIQCT